MRKDAEYTANGFYEPGMLHLEVATREDLGDFKKLTANPTFLHEYVHFLQDITTTHGLLNFIGYIEHLKNAIKKVTDDGGAEFDTPVRISNSFEYQTNLKLRKLYYGDPHCKAKAARYSGYRFEPSVIDTNGGKTIEARKYKVNYYDEGAYSNEACHFGSFHIKEYMAHAIQNQFSPNTHHDHIPYVLVELLIQNEYPQLAINTAFIVALCDASLMHYHPAQLFFDALERMKRLKWIPVNVDSVYAFVFDGLNLDWNGRTETFGTLYTSTVNLAIKSFSDALKDQYFKENVRWFNGVMNGALNLRQRFGGLLAKLVSSPGQLSQVFDEAFNEIGTPFMTNALYHGYCYPPAKLKAASIQSYFPWVFAAVSNTFTGKKECLLHSYCKALPDKQITDQNCENSPWERIHLSQLCPYAIMWHTWGLSAKKPGSTR
jgi:hypothetical protein